MIRHTASEHAPWIVVPADNKWFSRLLVVATVVDALQGLNLRYPELSKEQLEELKQARRHLEKE